MDKQLVFLQAYQDNNIELVKKLLKANSDINFQGPDGGTNLLILAITEGHESLIDVLIKYKDRHGKEVALGPTHEEIITDLVSREIKSYKNLPKTRQKSRRDGRVG